MIVPAFNAERFIVAALESVLRQTEQRFEIIVVDDCSTDATHARAADVARCDQRIKLLRHTRNRGPGAARNTAIDVAAGHWLALLDADDLYHPRRLERLMQLASRTRADMVADNIVLHHEGASQADHAMFSRHRIGCERRLTATEFVIENMGTGHGARRSFGFMQPMMRRDFLLRNEIRYQEGNRFGEDFLLYMNCLTSGARWWITPDAFYVYNVRQGSLVDRVTPDDLRAISVMEQQLLDGGAEAGGHDLVTAIRKHKRTIDHWRHTLAFQTAVKRRAIRQALSITFESRTSLRCISRDIAANAVLKAVRLLPWPGRASALAPGAGRR